MGDELLAPFLDGIQPKGGRCRIALILETLDESRAAQLRAALDTPGEHGGWRIPGTVVADVVTGWGAELKQGTVTRHRAGTCRCPR